MSENTIKVEGLEDGQVKVLTDRPGERATSATVDGKALIETIAEAMGIDVYFEQTGA